MTGHTTGAHMTLDHDSPDGMCVMAGCQFQAERLVSWQTSRGVNQAPLCHEHMRTVWERSIAGHMSRETFTTRPLP